MFEWFSRHQQEPLIGASSKPVYVYNSEISLQKGQEVSFGGGGTEARGKPGFTASIVADTT